MKENWKELEKEWREKVEKRLEKRFKEYEEKEEREERENNKVRNERMVFTTREGNGYESSGTVWSEDRLCSKEVEKIRKWVGEKERIDRKENIVLKEIRMPEDIETKKDKRIEWVKELIKRKLEVECRISEVRKVDQ